MQSFLKDLGDQQKGLQKQTLQRHKAAEDLIQKAVQSLEKYIQAPSRSTMQEAVEILIAASRQNRSNPLPYVLLGRIYWSLQLKQVALIYLKAAQEIAPQDERVQALSELLSSQRQPQIHQETNSPGISIANTDADTLYEELEGLLRTEINNAMQMALPLQPSCDPGLIQTLAGYKIHLAQTLKSIHNQLEIVERELDTSKLKQQLKPLETRLFQVRVLERECEEFVQLRSQIQACHAEVHKALQAIPVSADRLEGVLDQCDALADRLDHLSEQKIQIAELEDLYEPLIASISQWQDLLDGQ